MFGNNGKMAVRVLAGIFVGLVAFSCRVASAEPIKVQVYPGNITSLFAYLGVEEGFYKKHGLDVSLVNISNGPQANAALAGGSVDIIMTTPDNMLLFKARGFDPVAITGNAKEPVMSLVARDATKIAPAGSDYKVVMQGLVGKTVGVYGLGSAAHRYVKLLAKDAGVKDGAIKYSGVSNGAQSLAGLESGQMNAVTEVFASVIMIEQKKAGELLLDCVRQKCPAWATDTGKMSQAWWTTRAFLKKNPEKMRQFLAAHKEIDAWIHDRANRPALLKALEKIYLTPPELDTDKYFEAVADRVPDYFTVKTNTEAIAGTQKIMLATGELTKAVDVAPMVWDEARN